MSGETRRGWLRATINEVSPWNELDERDRKILWIILCVVAAAVSLLGAGSTRLCSMFDAECSRGHNYLALGFLGLALGAVPAGCLAKTGRQKIAWAATGTALFFVLIAIGAKVSW